MHQISIKLTSYPINKVVHLIWIPVAQNTTNSVVQSIQIYRIGYPRQPSNGVTLAELTFQLFLWNFQPTAYIKKANSSRGARQFRWASCLASASKVTLSGGTTFSHIDTLASLPGRDGSIVSGASVFKVSGETGVGITFFNFHLLINAPLGCLDEEDLLGYPKPYE